MTDKTYDEAKREADARTLNSFQTGAKMIGAYYKALMAEVGNQEFALEAASRIAMIWESRVEAAMIEQAEKNNDQ